MSTRITCQSCQTVLSLPVGVSPTATIKCPKCGQIVGSPAKLMLTPAKSENEAPIDQRPPITRPSLTGNPLLSSAVPGTAILLGLLGLAFPILFGRYLPALLISCVAALVSIAGLVLLALKKSRGVAVHLSATAISAAAILLAINVLTLEPSIARNEDLRVKNEQAAALAKTRLDDSAKKLAQAEDVRRIAEEAPKKAERILNSANDAKDKANAAEKRAAEILAKADEAGMKNEQVQMKIKQDSAKLALAQMELKARKQALDQMQREIDEKKQDLVTLKNEAEAHKKAAAEERKKADDKHKETRDLFKKIESALKSAALDLKDKNQAVRLKTAKALASLPAFPEAKEYVGEALVEAMIEPSPEMRFAVNAALEKIDPVAQPLILAFIIDKGKGGVWNRLGSLGKKGKSALPALLAYYRNPPIDEEDIVQISKKDWLDAITKIAPNDNRVIQLVLDEVQMPPKRRGLHFARQKAIALVDSIGGDKKDKVKALMTVLDYQPLTVNAIEAIARIGLPEGGAAIPVLMKLKLAPDENVRQAVRKALVILEPTK